jgi:putative spermidine/putrescine transport system permease protein
MFSQLTKPRQRPVTNVVAVFVVAITTLPILLANRWTRQDNE